MDSRRIANDLLANFGKLQIQLRDIGESHLGYLLGVALHIWKKEESVHVLKYHYTADGCQAEFWYPFDKKTYLVKIIEKREKEIPPC